MPESTSPPVQFPGRPPQGGPARLLTKTELDDVLGAVVGVARTIANRLCRDRRRQRPNPDAVFGYVMEGFWRCGQGFDQNYGDQAKPREKRFISYVWDAGFRAGIAGIDAEYARAETPTDAADAAEWVEGPPAAAVPEGWAHALAACGTRLERAVLVGRRDGRSFAELAAATGHPAARLMEAWEGLVKRVRAAPGIDPGG